MTPDAIGKYIRIEEATEAGHMGATPKGVRSTTKASARGRPRTTREDNTEERREAMEHAITVPQQEPENRKR